VRIVGRKQIEEFMETHADARPALSAWVAHVSAAGWRSPLEMLERHPRSSLVRDGLYVFNIKGNDYRLAARIDFHNEIVRVVRVGTHAEYDGWSL
jgi:mRNA interferase HigB